MAHAAEGLPSRQAVPLGSSRALWGRGLSEGVRAVTRLAVTHPTPAKPCTPLGANFAIVSGAMSAFFDG